MKQKETVYRKLLNTNEVICGYSSSHEGAVQMMGTEVCCAMSGTHVF